MFKFKISLKYTWIILIVLSSLVPVSLVMFWYGYKIYNTQLNSSLISEIQANELLKYKIEVELSRLKVILNHTATQLVSKVGSQSEANLLFKALIKQEPSVHAVLLLSKQQEVISIIEPSANLLGERNASKFELDTSLKHWQLANGKYSSEIVISSMGRQHVGPTGFHDDAYVFNIAIPVGKPVKAILVTRVDIKKMSSSWHNENLSVGKDKAKIKDYILDSRGSLISEITGSKYKIGSLMTHFAITRAALLSKKWNSSKSYIGVNNKPVFGTITPIPILNWSLVSEVNVESILQPIWHELIQLMIVTLFGLLFILCLVWYLLKITITPLQQASFAISRIAKGDYTHLLLASSINEINVLSCGFNDMVISRQQAEQSLIASKQKLALSEAKFRSIIEHAIDGILLVDESGMIELANPAIFKITGYSKDELIGQSVDLLVPKKYSHHYKLRENYNKNPQTRRMGDGPGIYGCRKDGKEFPADISLTPIVGGSKKLIAVMIQDVTKRRDAENKIMQQAHFDTLTKLPNRFLSLDRLSQLVTKAERTGEILALVFIDLDDFKKVNDSLGHETGDLLLVAAAERLASEMRDCDTVGRLGGDEFIVLLSNLNKIDDIYPIIESLVRNFRQPFTINNRELTLTISVGVAVYPEDGISASELLRNADTAMYYSKDLGRNTYTSFLDKMNKDVLRRITIEEKLRGALKNNELSLVYQPKLNLSNNKIMGAEALLRWHNEELGFILPDEFIPVAEDTGLIIEIGLFVFDEALKQAKNWLVEYDDNFSIAINLSPRQFKDPMLVANLQKKMQSSGVKSKNIEIEITEGIFMTGEEYIKEAMLQLSSLGFSIAMDDFGTGYSSLSYLRSYPFNILKIDRSFINDITVDQKDLELINAAIAMAHGLKLKVVAEGIETSEQLKYLKLMGCDYGQGYFFSKPISPDEFSKLLKTWDK